MLIIVMSHQLILRCSIKDKPKKGYVSVQVQCYDTLTGVKQKSPESGIYHQS